MSSPPPPGPLLSDSDGSGVSLTPSSSDGVGAGVCRGLGASLCVDDGLGSGVIVGDGDGLIVGDGLGADDDRRARRRAHIVRFTREVGEAADGERSDDRDRHDRSRRKATGRHSPAGHRPGEARPPSDGRIWLGVNGGMDARREVDRRAGTLAGGVVLELLGEAVELRIGSIELVGPVRVADHRSASAASAGRSRSRPRRRWVFTVFRGRPVVSAISASDSSPKKRSATVSR